MLEPLGSDGSRCSTDDITDVVGVAFVHQLFPRLVGQWARLNNAAPSVQSHYRTFVPTTNRSVPVLRIGTLVLLDLANWISPFASERQVPTFPTKARCRLAPSICRPPLGQNQVVPRTCPGVSALPRFRCRLTFSTLQQRFACARLSASHLPGSGPDFSATFTTIALYDRSLRGFEACA